MKQHDTLILEKPQQDPELPLWRACWADGDPINAFVHHYFFQAEDNEAAEERVFAWMRQPPHPLPYNARISHDYWQFPDISPYGLLIWRIIWLENAEKHMLFLFEPEEQTGAIRRARRWARQRNETLKHFQTLERLPLAQSSQAIFNPQEGRALFAR